MTSKSGVHRKVFRGSGEGDGDIGLFWIQVDSNELFTASFEFSTGGEQFRPSRVSLYFSLLFFLFIIMFPLT